MSNDKGRPNHAPGCQCATHGGRQRGVPQGGAKYHRSGCQCVVHRSGGYLCSPDCRCGRHNSPANRLSLEDLLIEDRRAGSGSRIKERLIVEGLLEDRCETCGMGPEWNDDPLALQLDHRNGNPRDWRLMNLRVLCPNCHSQTESFAGRNKNNGRSDSGSLLGSDPSHEGSNPSLPAKT